MKRPALEPPPVQYYEFDALIYFRCCKENGK